MSPMPFAEAGNGLGMGSWAWLDLHFVIGLLAGFAISFLIWIWLRLVYRIILAILARTEEEEAEELRMRLERQQASSGWRTGERDMAKKTGNIGDQER